MTKILITGGRGLVGKAILNLVNQDTNYIFTSSREADLSNYESCYNLFQKYQPTHVIHLAAYVGGLYKNMNHKVDMLEKNLMINYNVVKCSHIFKVKKFIGCLSTCIFPDKTTYPINEEMLNLGPPHNSNDAYAYAKRMLDIHCQSYRQQYNDNFFCIIPTNIYGPDDNFHLEDSHVIPGLIHKCYMAEKNNTDFIVSGSGKPLRQFIHSYDLARIILWLIKNDGVNQNIIISPDENQEVSIKEIAEIIASEFNYLHCLKFDLTKSDGQYKKTADNKKLKKLYGDLGLINIKSGIQETIKWFCYNYESCRK
jgi:GDP-L-fucose synthase